MSQPFLAAKFIDSEVRILRFKSLLPPGCVTLGRLLNLSVHQFSHLLTEDNKNINFLGCCED